MPSPPPLRVGCVPYLVGRPLCLDLADEPGLDLALDVPAVLARRLDEGSLDVALVSSIRLLERPGWTFLPGLAVAGDGPVSSVQVFFHAERRPTATRARTVALDPASRAARTLLQVLAADPEAARALGALELVEVPAGQDPRAADTDGWLRIGDRALAEVLVEDPPRVDLADLWKRVTGLPFVFAAWIARPGVDLAPWSAAFARAAERGLEAREDLARAAATTWGLPPDAVVDYLVRECVYRLEPALQLAALAAFGQRAARLGLADPRAVTALGASAR